MRPLPVLAVSIAVAAIAVGGFVALSVGDDSENAPPGSGTGYTVTTPETATPTPLETPQPGDPLPVAVWTEIDPLDTMDAGAGDFFVLDTQTGKMFSPIASLPDPYTQVSIQWLANGQVSIHMYGSGGGPTSGQSATYVGDLFGAMRLLPGGHANVSARGVTAYDTDDATVLYDVRAGREIGTVANRPLGNVGGWSPEGRYLSFHAGNSLLKQATQTTIWDIETRKVIAEVPATGVSWSDTGHGFLYGLVDPDDEDERVVETREFDLATGTERLVSRASLSDWSPGGRYALGTSYYDWETRHSFSIYDVSTGLEVLTVKGSWPMSWIDSDTIGFMGGVCGPSSYYTVNVDGSSLERLRDFDWSTVAHPSHQGDQVAYSVRDDYKEPIVTTVVNVKTGASRDFVTGGVALQPYAMSSEQWWSADDRYLLLHNRGGRDGPCFETQPQTLELIKHP